MSTGLDLRSFIRSKDDFLQKGEHEVNQFTKKPLLSRCRLSVDHSSKLPCALF